MNEISNIHAFEDEDFLHACFVWGMAVLVVFAVCLVPVFMLLGGPADLDVAAAGGWMAVLGWMVGLTGFRRLHLPCTSWCTVCFLSCWRLRARR